jgi:hypothetical protein
LTALVADSDEVPGSGASLADNLLSRELSGEVDNEAEFSAAYEKIGSDRMKRAVRKAANASFERGHRHCWRVTSCGR